MRSLCYLSLGLPEENDGFLSELPGESSLHVGRTSCCRKDSCLSTQKTDPGDMLRWDSLDNA